MTTAIAEIRSVIREISICSLIAIAGVLHQCVSLVQSILAKCHGRDPVKIIQLIIYSYAIVRYTFSILIIMRMEDHPAVWEILTTSVLTVSQRIHNVSSLLSILVHGAYFKRDVDMNYVPWSLNMGGVTAKIYHAIRNFALATSQQLYMLAMMRKINIKDMDPWTK